MDSVAMKHGADLARQAVQKDMDGQYEESVQLYIGASQQLMLVLTESSLPDAMRTKVKRSLTNYLQRAESLKDQLKLTTTAAPAPAAAPASTKIMSTNPSTLPQAKSNSGEAERNSAALISTALLILRDGLRQYLVKEQVSADITQQEDVTALLNYLWRNWQEEFSRLPPFARTLVAECKYWRNHWAHNNKLTVEDSWRICDSCERLLRILDPKGLAANADEIVSLKNNLMRPL